MTEGNFLKLKADVHKLHEKHKRLHASISAKHISTPSIRLEIESEFHKGAKIALERVIQMVEGMGQVDLLDYQIEPQGRSQAV